MVRASRIIGYQGTTDPGGGVGGSRRSQPAWQLPVGRGLGPHWTSSTQAFPPLGSHSTDDRGQYKWKLPDCTEVVLGGGNPMVPIPPVEMGRDSSSVVPQVSGARRHGRGMRPAGGTRPFPRRIKNELTDGGRTLEWCLFRWKPRSLPKIRVRAGAGSHGSGDCVPSRRKDGEIVGRCDAGVPTTAVAGAAALADIAGAAAPVDLAGMKFSAVAEVHSSAVDDEGDPSVIRTIGQQSAVVLDPMAASRTDSGPMDEMSVLEPLENSVLGVSLEGYDSYVNEVAVPNPLEHSGVGKAADVLSETSVPEPLGSIHTKNARVFCCGNSDADLLKPHTFKWGTLADDVFPSANFTLPPKPRPPTGPI